MGNGAKAQQKRERNADKAAGKGGKSQLKANEASLTLICVTCRQTFMNTTRAPALEQHSKDRHEKTIAECFPTFKA